MRLLHYLIAIIPQVIILSRYGGAGGVMVTSNAILKEDGSFILAEDSSKILME